MKNNKIITYDLVRNPSLCDLDSLPNIERKILDINKETDILIPVYINNDDNAMNYEKIKEVLKYLILDVELIKLPYIVVELPYPYIGVVVVIKFHVVPVVVV